MDADPDRLIAVARAMFAAWEARDVDAVVARFAPDGVLHSMMRAPLIGRDAIRPQVAFLLAGASRLRLDVRTWAVGGDTVIAERVDHFTFRGRDGEIPVVGALRIAAEHVLEWREYFDRAALLVALGLPPES